MQEIKFITTHNCILCSKGFIKVQRLFKFFFVIKVINAEQENKEYIFRVPVVLYRNKILDEGELSSIKLILNFIKSLIF